MLRIASLAAVVCVGCHSSAGARPSQPESAASCAQRREGFVALVRALPSRTVASPTHVSLPLSTLGRLPGPGPLLEVTESDALVDGEALSGATLPERSERFRQWAEAWLAAGASSAEPSVAAPQVGANNDDSKGAPVLYVAAASDVPVQTLRAYVLGLPPAVQLRLLVRNPPRVKGSSQRESDGAGVSELPAELLFEPDPTRREAIAERGYATFARCPAIDEAVAAVRGFDARRRWPALQAALGRAAPACDCSALDTTNLAALVTAEQRSGAATLGWVPLSFVRDERCGASMPLRSTKKLLQQIEGFDEEFAGGWEHDALKFDDVLTNDRLRVYFCNALPGETLAMRERARAILYVKVPGAAACEAWQFEPLSPGAPMGTWKRTSGPRSPLAFHYWQAAEELRVYGPVDPGAPSRPTDTRDWACEQTYRLTGIDDDSIQFEGGLWFFDEAACRRAPDSAGRPSLCVPVPAEAPPAGAPASGVR